MNHVARCDRCGQNYRRLPGARDAVCPICREMDRSIRMRRRQRMSWAAAAVALVAVGVAAGRLLLRGPPGLPQYAQEALATHAVGSPESIAGARRAPDLPVETISAVTADAAPLNPRAAASAPAPPPRSLSPLPKREDVRRIVIAVCGTPDERRMPSLRERVKDLVASLRETQVFGLVICDSDAPQPPGGLQWVRATSEQKVRAYDRIDRARAAGPCVDGAGLAAAVRASNPDMLWLFCAGEPNRHVWEPVLSGPVITRAVMPAPPPDWLKFFLDEGRVSFEPLAGANDRPDAALTRD